MGHMSRPSRARGLKPNIATLSPAEKLSRPSRARGLKLKKRGEADEEISRALRGRVD